MVRLHFMHTSFAPSTQLTFLVRDYQIAWRPRSERKWTRLVLRKTGRRAIFLGPLGDITYGRLLDPYREQM